MLNGEDLSTRISKSIQGRMTQVAEADPDGTVAMYLWLWRTIGRRPGPTLIPRFIRFSLLASLDLISLGGWYVRTRIFRVSRSAIGRASVVLLATALGLSLPLQVSGQGLEDEAVIGTWEGELDAPDGTQLLVVFNVERGEDGGLIGTMESPDQTDMVFPLSSVTFDDGELTLVVSSIPGSPTFTGTLSADGTTLGGTFSQGPTQLPLELTKSD